MTRLLSFSHVTEDYFRLVSWESPHARFQDYALNFTALSIRLKGRREFLVSSINAPPHKRMFTFEQHSFSPLQSMIIGITYCENCPLPLVIHRTSEEPGHIVVVTSTLLSLMEHQVSHLNEIGLKAANISSLEEAESTRVKSEEIPSFKDH